MHVEDEFETLLRDRGLWEALRFLNLRMTHRFTGAYRFEGTVLRNISLFDRSNPNVRHGDDFPMTDAPCAHVGAHGGQLVVAEFLTDPRFLRSFDPIVSYCGALIQSPDGSHYGTLCHFDTKSCQTSSQNAVLLEAVAPIVYAALEGEA